MRRRAALAFGAAASLGAIAGLVRATGRPIVVWYTVEGAKAMRAIGERFTAETGVPVVVETPDDGPAKPRVPARARTSTSTRTIRSAAGSAAGCCTP
jgi:maltose/maltodextrin transport system substrate-binding protein